MICRTPFAGRQSKPDNLTIIVFPRRKSRQSPSRAKSLPLPFALQRGRPPSPFLRQPLLAGRRFLTLPGENIAFRHRGFGMGIALLRGFFLPQRPPCRLWLTSRRPAFPDALPFPAHRGLPAPPPASPKRAPVRRPAESARAWGFPCSHGRRAGGRSSPSISKKEMRCSKKA